MSRPDQERRPSRQEPAAAVPSDWRIAIDLAAAVETAWALLHVTGDADAAAAELDRIAKVHPRMFLDPRMNGAA